MCRPRRHTVHSNQLAISVIGHMPTCTGTCWLSAQDITLNANKLPIFPSASITTRYAWATLKNVNLCPLDMSWHRLKIYDNVSIPSNWHRFAGLSSTCNQHLHSEIFVDSELKEAPRWQRHTISHELISSWDSNVFWIHVAHSEFVAKTSHYIPDWLQKLDITMCPLKPRP